GIRLNWVRRETLPDVTSAAYRALLARVKALGWQVEIYLEGPKLAQVLPQLRAQDLRVVVDHFGAPDPAAGVACRGFQEVLAGVRAGDTYVKLSAPYRLGGCDPRRYVRARLAPGPRQLVRAGVRPFGGLERAIP